MNYLIGLVALIFSTNILLTSCINPTVKDKPVTYITEKPLNIDTSEYKIIKDMFKIESVELVADYYGGLKPKYEMAKVSIHQLESDLCRPK